MELFKFSFPKIGRLQIYGERLNTGYDFLIQSNSKDNNIEQLIFLDSRGVGREFEGSLAEKIVKKIYLKKRYMILCRPLKLTTWATLFNLLSCNKLKPQKIITNMGFVDFTPQKKNLLENAIRQVEHQIGKNVAKAKFAEKY